MATTPTSSGGIDWTAIYGQNNVAAQMLSDLSLNQYENLAIQPLAEQLSALQNQLQALQQQQGAWQTLQQDASAWTQAMTALGSSTTWQAEQATSSDSGVLTAAADGTATPGTFTFSVTQLALSEIDGTASTSLTITSPTAALGLTAGTMALTMGTVTFSVAVSSTTTLDQLAADLNGAGLPWTAQVEESPSGDYYLQIFGSPTDQSISYGGSSLAYWADVGIMSPSTGSASGYQVNVVQAAQPAVISLGGAQYQSATNTFASVLPGVTLVAQGTGTATITVSPDVSSMAQAVQAMVNDWNQWVQDTFQLAFGTLPPTGSGSSLAFPPNPKQVLQSPMPIDTINAISQQLMGFTQNGLGLADFGVSIGSTTPTMTINGTSLSAAISSSPAAAEAFFTALASVVSGLGSGFDSGSGVAGSALSDLSQSETQLQGQQTQIEEEITSLQQSLQSQYTAWMDQLTQVAQTDQLLAGLQQLQGGNGSGG